MKRIISMLLLIAMLTVTLAACGGDKGNDPVETTPAKSGSESTPDETTEAETTEYMPAKDLGGYVFRVLHGNKMTGMVPDDELDDMSVVAQAQIKRDSEVKDKLNISYEDVAYVDDAKIGDYVMRDAMGSEATYDVGWLYTAENLATLITQDVLMDINEMPYMDLSQDWYGGEANKAFEVMGKQHYFTSAFPTLPGSSYFVFNKKMMDDLNLEYPYEQIFEGTWTIEKLQEYTAAAYVDIDDVAGPSGMDQFGYSGLEQSVAYFYQGMGGVTCTKDENGALIPVISNPTVDAIYEKVQEFYKNPNHWTDNSLKVDDPTCSHRVFYDGRSLFCFWVTATIHFRDIDTFEYGISILPKYDEDQSRYYCFAVGGCNVMPGNMADPETVGYIFESLSEASWRLVYPANIQEAKRIETLSDEQSIEVKKLMDRSLTYDVLRKLDPSNGQLKACAFVLYCLRNNTTPAAQAPTAQPAIEKMFNDFFYPAS